MPRVHIKPDTVVCGYNPSSITVIWETKIAGNLEVCRQGYPDLQQQRVPISLEGEGEDRYTRLSSDRYTYGILTQTRINTYTHAIYRHVPKRKEKKKIAKRFVATVGWLYFWFTHWNSEPHSCEANTESLNNTPFPNVGFKTCD